MIDQTIKWSWKMIIKDIRNSSKNTKNRFQIIAM